MATLPDSLFAAIASLKYIFGYCHLWIWTYNNKITPSDLLENCWSYFGDDKALFEGPKFL